jgi:plant 4alpha-monomethylsterol monooxygenase
VHGWHHRIVTPWAVTGHYMHPVEYVLTGTIALVGPLLVGAHVAVLWIWFAWRQWEAAEGHSGYDFPWSPSHWFPGSDGARHHDWHHARVRGNYAGFFPIWDRACGTFAKGYAEVLAR